MQIDTTRILIRRRLSTILAADVAGYSRLMGANEERTLERLDEARAVMDAMIARHGGRIANTAGDSVIAEFPNPAEAVRCALAVQEELREQHAAAPVAEPLQFRIGINLGTIMANGRDVLGDNVNIAARIENIAQPGGICISGAVYDRIKGELGAAFRCLGPQTLKNISRPVLVYAAGMDAAPPAVAPPPRRRRRLPLALLAAAGLVVAAVVALVATGVIRIAPSHPAASQAAPSPESLLPSPLPEPAAGPAPDTVGAAAPIAPAVAVPAVAAPLVATPASPASELAAGEAPSSAPSQVAMLPTATDTANLAAAALQAIQGFECAGLQMDAAGADFTLSGYVGSAADAKAAVARVAALRGVNRVDDQISVLPPPLCSALNVLDQEGSTALLKPLLDEGGAGGYYYEGDNLKVGVTPSADGYLYVDLVDAQTHEVVHLLPNDARSDNRVKAGQLVVIGTLAPERKLYTVGPPFGAKLLFTMQSPKRLFTAKRKFREPADLYLADLRERLHALRAAGGKDSPLSAHTLVVFRHH
jgi:class 3 adenylate cyclase